MGFGPDKDMLPLDVNVTFFFDYVKATVETIEIWNRTDTGNVSLGMPKNLSSSKSINLMFQGFMK